MKIVIDENISFAKEAFSRFGNLVLLNGRKITNAELIDADILITRSITNVNQKLLEGTNIKFIGTATIGTDHIDENYLHDNNIKFCSVAGCNSDAVKEYVFTAISKVITNRNITSKNLKLGAIGFGNIGRKVAELGRILGFKVLINDPPLQRIGMKENFHSLEEILACDIITCHVPLNIEGIDKTVHLINDSNLSLIKPGSLLINSSRGEVIDNTALLNRLNNKNDLHVVLDVWENEPNFNISLLKKINYASPHIAGYTLEGKVNGTKIIFDELCKFLNVDFTWQPTLPKVSKNKISLIETNDKLEQLNNIFSFTYNIKNDLSLMLKAVDMDEETKIKYFDSLRKNYILRRELNNYFVEENDIYRENKYWLNKFNLFSNR